MNIKAIFGKKLHSYRKKFGFSQEKLSEKLDISIKHLSDLETGKSFVSAELLEKISEELGVPASSLFFTPEEKTIDDTEWSEIDEILSKESEKAIIAIKLKIHELQSKKHITN